MADYDITFGGDFAEVDKALAALDKRATATLRKIGKEFDKAQKPAKKWPKAVDKVGKSFDKNLKGKAVEGFTAAKEAAEGFGGTLGGTFGMIDKFGKSLSAAAGALGPVGVGLAVGTVGIGLFAIATVGAVVAVGKAISSVRAWREELEELGIEMDQEGVRAVDDLSASMDAIGVVAKRIAIDVFAGTLAPMLERVAFATVKAFLVFEDLKDQWQEGTAAARAYVEGIAEMGGVLGKLAGFALAEKDAIKLLDVATSDYDEEAQALIDTLFRQDEATKAVTKSTFDEEKALKQISKILDANSAELVRASEESFKLGLETLRLGIVYDETFASATQGFEDVAAAQEATAQSLKQALIPAYVELGMEIGKATGQALGGFADLAAASQAILSNKLEDTQAAIDAARERGDTRAVRAMQAREKQIQAQLLRSFKAEKTLGTSEATINGAVAFTQALSVPVIGPVLAAGIAASTAAQIALIQSQRPPTFAGGGMVGDRVQGDHVVVAADPEEAILTRGGIEAAGGRAGVDALNSRLGGGGAGQVIRFELARGVIAEAIINDDATRNAILRLVGGTSTRGRL